MKRPPVDSFRAAAPWALVPCLALLLSTAAPGEDRAGETAPSPAEAVTAADDAYNQAARERDREAFRELLAPEVVFLAGEVQKGRLAVLGIWQPLFEGKFDFRYQGSRLDAQVSESGDLAYTVGGAETRFTRPGLSEPEVTDSHYLNIWAPDDQGKWVLQVASSLVVHPTLGAARDPRSGLMTAWPELADQIGSEIELSWKPEKTVRAASGELAYTFGTYDAAFRPPGEGAEPQTGSGHFVAVWHKDDKGTWQLAAEGFTPPGIYWAAGE